MKVRQAKRYIVGRVFPLTSGGCDFQYVSVLWPNGKARAFDRKREQAMVLGSWHVARLVAEFKFCRATYRIEEVVL